MKKISLLLLIILLFTGCAKKGLSEDLEVVSNDDFQVSLLFEVDGVKVYRFKDARRWRYFTVGDGSYLPSVLSTGGKNPNHWYDGATTY